MSGKRQMSTENRGTVTPSFKRFNLLSALEERRRGQQHRFILHRLFYVADKSEARIDYRDLSGYHDRLFHNIVKTHLGEAISGLLLIYPMTIVHILESSIDVLYCVLQDLVEMQKRNSMPLLKNAKILIMSHNIPVRLFPQWYFRIISLPVRYMEESLEGQSMESVVMDSLTQLLKLSVFFSKTARIGSKGPGENLHDVAPQLLLREATVSYLCASKEWLTPDQFLAQYNKPVQISAASDDVWPIPGHVYL
ncbi:testis-expressed protein 47-like isoform X1 [Lissotriton helveticus]